MNSRNQNYKPPVSGNDSFNLPDLFQMVNRRKGLILLAVVITLAVAIIYNYLAAPQYQASVVIKKEKTGNDRRQDQFRNIILMETQDEIETEIEILQSRTVLEKVVEGLDLNFIIEKIEYPYRTPLQLNHYLAEYNARFPGGSSKSGEYPGFRVVEFLPGYGSGSFYIRKTEDRVFELRHAENDSLLLRAAGETSEFSWRGVTLNIEWPEGKTGGRVFFTIRNPERTITGLSEKIKVEKIRKTDIFKIYVNSSSPVSAQLIANTVADKYRETRIEQKKQTIRYSFVFLDRQLQSISQKLKTAETALSSFQSENQLISIDENSKSVIAFLNTLETEKVATDLELSEYQNKLSEMSRELENKIFFDQTFLTPDRADVNRTPFSELLRQLSDTELRRLELMQKRTANHPDVIALDERIRQIAGKLANYNQNTITAYQIIINSLKSKQSDLQQLIEKYMAKISRLPAQQTKLIELMREKSVYEKIFTLLLDKREEMRMAELSQLQDLVIVDRAHLPLEPVSPRKKLNLAIGIGIGLMIGLLTIFIQEYQGNKITTLDEIEKGFAIPILSVIPKYNRKIQKRVERAENIDEALVNLMDDEPVYKESYRNLRTKLINLHSAATKTILITSCEENAGKTSIVANLAVSLARMGKQVLVIDGDLRKFQLGKVFRLKKVSTGLGDYLTKDIQLLVYRPFDLSGRHDLKIDLIPAGRYHDDSSELFSTSKMKKMIEAAKLKYDYILLDTPPITRIVDAFVLGKIVRDVVLVVRPNFTYKDGISWAVREFEQSGMNLLGLVVNGIDLTKTLYRYRYRYGYGDLKENKPAQV